MSIGDIVTLGFLCAVMALPIGFFAWVSAGTLTEESRTALARTNQLQAVLKQPGDFWVWHMAGLDEGVEYSRLYATVVQSGIRYDLAHTSEVAQRLKALRAAGIAVHNGPLGTVD